jgi:YTH domain-containing family protein
MRYSSPGTGISQFYPMHQYYSPDEVHYSVTPSFYQPFGSLNGGKNSFCRYLCGCL